jgi:hypothetical protein
VNVGPVELGVTVKQLDIWKGEQLADSSLSLGAKRLFISVLNTVGHARHHLEVSEQGLSLDLGGSSFFRGH